jgi:hypothetical protein
MYGIPPKILILTACISLFLCPACAILKGVAVSGDGLTDRRAAINMEDAAECVPGTYGVIFIGKSGSFEEQECKARCLPDKVIILKSSSCDLCLETEPDFLAACEERGITPLILDLVIPSDYAIMDSMGIDISGTPVFILGCDYYLGIMDSKEEYLEIIDIFLSRQ